MGELEDLLPEPEIDDLDDVHKKDKYWIKLPNGQPCHKSSAVKYLLCSEDGKKSTDRLSRVQGLSKIRTYSRSPSAPSLNDDSLLGDAFLVNQLIATFARIDNQVALAIMRVSAIEDKTKTLVPSIPAADLASPDITLRGQILTLAPTDASTWVWMPNTYESFAALKKQGKSANELGPTSSVTRKSTLIEVPACLSTPIKVKLEQQDDQDSPSIAWKFDTAALVAVTEIGDNLCGFCGRTGTCTLTLTKPSKTIIPNSDCPYFIKFSLLAAEKTTTSGLATNCPLQCDICLSQELQGRYRLAKHVYWSYNLPAHVETKHPSASIPEGFEESYMVSRDEMVHLRLAKGTVSTTTAKQGPGQKRKP
ncbi:hypothetical protein EWM64_g8887, partial [Hericium alpestre]